MVNSLSIAQTQYLTVMQSFANLGGCNISKVGCRWLKKIHCKYLNLINLGIASINFNGNKLYWEGCKHLSFEYNENHEYFS